MPRNQCKPDCMHRCHNMLHNVLLAGVRQLLCDKGVSAAEAQRICSMGLQEAEDWDADVAIKKSIAPSLRCFRLDGFTQLIGKLDAYLANSVCLSIHLAMKDTKGLCTNHCPLTTTSPGTRH